MGHEASTDKLTQVSPTKVVRFLEPSRSHDTGSKSKSTLALMSLTSMNRYDASAKSASNLYTHSSKEDSAFAKREIHNGVTGVYLSASLAETNYVFWKRNIDCLSRDDYLEIGCSIYFTMLRCNKSTKQILKKYSEFKEVKNGIRSSGHNIKKLGLRFIDMIGWFTRQLLTNNIDLKSALAQLGVVHQALGVNVSHFAIMLAAVHETFSYYFDHKYSIKEKYAMDKLFTVAAKLMMDEDLDSVETMHLFEKAFKGLDFLTDLATCLKSDVGRPYLYQYFRQTFCDELVIYLRSIRRYQAATVDKERFIIARDICKTCIASSAPFAVNISYETRSALMNNIKVLKSQFLLPSSSQPFEVPATLFDDCEREIRTLIRQNHWLNFKNSITRLQSD